MIVLKPEKLSGIIDMFYEAVSDPSQWQTAIETLRVTFNASTACLARYGPDLQPGDVVNSNPDPEYQLRFIAEHAPHPNLYAETLGAAPVGLIYSDRALVGEEALRRSRFWNEWMAPQDMYDGLGSKLLTAGPSYWFFDVQRGRNQERFDTAELQMLGLLAPHLRRAAELGFRLKSAEALASSTMHLPFGMVFVDSRMRVIHLNDIADRILTRTGSPLRLKSGTLATADVKTTAALQRLVATACAADTGAMPGTGGDLLLRTDGDEMADDLALTISPAGGGDAARFPQSSRHAIIYLRRLTLALPDGSEHHLRQLFDLTPAEARLAAALASGVALKDAAARQGIRFSTARSYLESIFRKTRTRQQSQLVALLKSTQPLAG